MLNQGIVDRPRYKFIATFPPLLNESVNSVAGISGADQGEEAHRCTEEVQSRETEDHQETNHIRDAQEGAEGLPREEPGHEPGTGRQEVNSLAASTAYEHIH